MNKPESDFVKQFRKEAMRRGWEIAIVPDLNDYGNRKKDYRPFDFVLITKTNVFCIEAKANNNWLEKEQKGSAKRLEKCNPMAYWVIRKNKLSTGFWYYIEKFIDNEKVLILKSTQIKDLLDHFEQVKNW